MVINLIINSKKIMEETILGSMVCPNCGLEMGTTGLPCMCGYNPKTGKVEESPLSKMIEDCISHEE